MLEDSTIFIDGEVGGGVQKLIYLAGVGKGHILYKKGNWVTSLFDMFQTQIHTGAHIYSKISLKFSKLINHKEPSELWSLGLQLDGVAIQPIGLVIIIKEGSF